MSCENVFEKYDVYRDSDFFKAKREGVCEICKKKIRRNDVICKVYLREREEKILDGIPVRFGYFGYAHKKCAENLKPARRPCPRCGSINVETVWGDSDFNRFCKKCGYAWWTE